jgi:8-oxo-dGTP pyrophosphatase MutT (NUDIX family)
MKQIRSAGIVVYRTQNNLSDYLLIQHVGGTEHWDFPKGKLEAGEDELQAALRELKEETGLDVIVQGEFQESFSYDFTDFDGAAAHKTVTFFIGLAQTYQIKLSEEHKEAQWLPYEQAREKLTFPNAKILLDRVQAFVSME